MSLTSSDIFAFARRRGIKQIRLRIYQPKLDSRPQEWVCKLETLEFFAHQLADGAKAVRAAETDTRPTIDWDAMYLNQNPNDEDCAFCRAAADCPSRRKQAAEVAFGRPAIDASDFENLEMLTVNESSNAQWLASVKSQKESVIAFFEAVDSEMMRRLLADASSIEGYGLDTGREGNRKFTNEVLAEETLKSFKLKEDDIFEKSLRTPTQLEKLAKPKKGVTPKITEDQWQKIELMVTRSEAKPVVKPIGDVKKPYVRPEIATDDFNIVE